MSMKAVIAAVLLALALGGILFLVNNNTPKAKGPPPAPLAFDPAAVSAIRITPPGQAEMTAMRSADGGWTTSLGALDWPLDPAGPQKLLAELSAMSAQPVARGTKPPADPVSPLVVAIALRDGKTHTVRLAVDGAGGLVAAKVDEAAPMLVKSSVVDAARNPGIGGWRVLSALPGAATDPARITITAGESTLGFERENGRWALRRPVAARADQKAVSELVGRLGRLPIERIIDKPTPADRTASGLDKPRLVVQVEREVRSTGPSLTMGTAAMKGRELYVGRAAGAATAVYTAPDRSGNVMFHVPADAITSISTALRTYLASTATDVSPSDVQIVSIRRGDSAETGYRRQMGNWTRMDAGAAAGTPVDAALIDGLLTFLTTQPGEPDAVLPGRSDGVRVLSRVTLVDIDGETRDALSVGYNADGVLAVRSGNLVILYPGAVAPEILGMPSFAELPPLPNENRRVSPGPGVPEK